MKSVSQLGCVLQDSDALDSQGRKHRGNLMPKVLGPIRRVRFTRSTLRQASIREKKGPSLDFFVKVPHRSPNSMKFEDRSHEVAERQQRCARSKAWNLAKTCTSSKKKTRMHSTFPRKMGTPGCVNKRAGGKLVCGRFQSQYAYGQQARP